MEARGKQDLWLMQKPEVLEVLRELAIIQSVESSNRIEGVTIPAHRLRPVALAIDKPRDRSEEELAGYRKALDWIFSRKQSITITPGILKQLHAFAQGGVSGDAGEWKKRSNNIIEILPTGEKKIRFVPTSAKDTPNAIGTLCRNYRNASENQQIPHLLLVASFVFDLLCIHPFRDGNGRVSRLVTTLLLQSNRFFIGRFISLERIVEETKDEYYDVLSRCSHAWHQGGNEIIPWWNYFMSTLRQAYQQLEQKMESVQTRASKSDLVQQTVLAQIEPFKLADLVALLPSTSRQLIKKVLSELKKQGKVSLTGRGRGARWEIIF